MHAQHIHHQYQIVSVLYCLQNVDVNDGDIVAPPNISSSAKRNRSNDAHGCEGTASNSVDISTIDDAMAVNKVCEAFRVCVCVAVVAHYPTYTISTLQS